MNKKQIAVAAITVGLAAGLQSAALASVDTDEIGLFQMEEITTNQLLAEGDHKCGKGKCGSDHDDEEELKDDHDDHGDEDDHGHGH